MMNNTNNLTITDNELLIWNENRWKDCSKNTNSESVCIKSFYPSGDQLRDLRWGWEHPNEYPDYIDQELVKLWTNNQN